MANEKPPEDGKYIVQDGEWAGSIALKFGYTDWKHDVWMRGENKDLRENRDPFVLAEGDELFVPPWEEKEEDCATEKRHKFKLKAPTETLRIKLLAPNGKPFKNMNYKLMLTYDPGGGSFKQANQKTDADGILCETIPSTTTKGKLALPDMKQVIKLNFGYLTPMDPKDEPKLIRGAQQRLLSIGFSPGPINGKMNPMLEGALKAFQQYCSDWKDKLPHVTDAGDVDGTLSDKTQKALLKFYGA